MRFCIEDGLHLPCAMIVPVRRCQSVYCWSVDRQALRICTSYSSQMLHRFHSLSIHFFLTNTHSDWNIHCQQHRSSSWPSSSWSRPALICWHFLLYEHTLTEHTWAYLAPRLCQTGFWWWATSARGKQVDEEAFQNQSEVCAVSA